MVKTRQSASFSFRAAWTLLLSISILLSLAPWGSEAAESCPECSYVDSLLKPCNSSLNMLSWPGTMVYQPTPAQAKCGCNQNYYGQAEGCMRCQSSTSAHYSVKDLEGYKLVCLSMGETWKEIYIPGQTSASTTAEATGPTAPPVPSDESTSGKHAANNLSNGAVAGIVVSVIALVVALTVAGYVWRKRRRESVRGEGVNDEYKFSDTQRDSYMEAALPQYTGMIQPTLPPLSNISNLRVMNPDSEDEDLPPRSANRNDQNQPSFEVNRNSSPGWRRGSFDDD
ncbi:hypothetical protein KVV02_004603 [Mortierella alpina]|uniref:Uncharacterized protein n=1 Tax=Mortierella alpina TaxID=64518 RepID=A0A9P8A612_MORAP|nr:hypothetical protein KVV02_004603 [Mortierella alpina]